MNKSVFRLVFVAALEFIGVNVSAFAAHGGGGAAGGMAAGHMSSHGIANTNGPASSDRDKGLARAEDRRSPQGATHENAGRKIKHRHATHR